MKLLSFFLIEVYHWKLASDVHGLPYNYEIILKMWDWHELTNESDGAQRVFVKNGQKVYIVSITETLEIHFD